MRVLPIALTVCGFLFFGPLPGAETAAQVTSAPASGGVEIEDIEIIRRSALGAAKGADLTNMRIRLWFSGTWKTPRLGVHHLVHLHSLSPIEDNTGRLLSTKKRLKRIDYLRGEVHGSWWAGLPGKEGPVICLLLEAPARRAEKIKAIKGKAEVSLAKAVHLKFDDLCAINGKKLAHPDLKGLKTLELSFSIHVQDGEVMAKVKAPFNYASPWNRGRLLEWTLMDGKKEINLSSEAKSPKDDGFAVERTYDRQSYKGWSLHLMVLDPVETKTFNFDFARIELP